jgi:hypothetical protein
MDFGGDTALREMDITKGLESDHSYRRSHYAELPGKFFDAGQVCRIIQDYKKRPDDCSSGRKHITITGINSADITAFSA